MTKKTCDSALDVIENSRSNFQGQGAVLSLDREGGSPTRTSEIAWDVPSNAGKA